jgi:hypothetical protein
MNNGAARPEPAQPETAANRGAAGHPSSGEE